MQPREAKLASVDDMTQGERAETVAGDEQQGKHC